MNREEIKLQLIRDIKENKDNVFSYLAEKDARFWRTNWDRKTFSIYRMSGMNTHMVLNKIATKDSQNGLQVSFIDNPKDLPNGISTIIDLSDIHLKPIKFAVESIVFDDACVILILDEFILINNDYSFEIKRMGQLHHLNYSFAAKDFMGDANVVPGRCRKIRDGKVDRYIYVDALVSPKLIERFEKNGIHKNLKEYETKDIIGALKYGGVTEFSSTMIHLIETLTDIKK